MPTMPKSKTARLSLTMPDAVRVSADLNRPSTKDGAYQIGSRAAHARDNDVVDLTHDHVWPKPPSSRSISPAQLPISATTNQSTSPASPTSPTSPCITSLPPFPSSSENRPKHARDPSKSFFANLKASKSSIKIQPPDISIRKVSHDTNEDEMRLRKSRSTPDFRGAQATEPVPDLPPLDSNVISSNTAPAEHAILRRPVGLAPNPHTNGSGPSPGLSPELPDSQKKPSLFANLMKRNHSGRPDDGWSSKPPTPTLSKAPDLRSPNFASPHDSDRSRNPSPHSDDFQASRRNDQSPKRKEPSPKSQATKPQFKGDGTGSHFLHGIKNTTVKAAKAAEGLGKAGNRFFRNNRSANAASPYSADIPPTYHCTVINLPLIQQTRRTRIAKRLEDSKDKTEFWMPSLPWRCIDYLNFNGCESEGLYRVPGSEREIRLWKQRFDTEGDINLFNQEGLYDVNIIGSLFKAWLRDLPDEIFPKSIQDKISDEHSSLENAPESLKVALSNLPPWNYYLLFAITCHLSLLHAYSEKNKMGYNNLVICFAPALKMNGDCFRWLVTDWRNCWKGCCTEKEALEQEYRIIDGVPGVTNGDPEEHDLTPDDNDGPSPYASNSRAIQQKPAPLALVQHFDSANGRTEGNVTSAASMNGPGSPDQMRSDLQFRNPSQLPELSLPKPISPIFTSSH